MPIEGTVQATGEFAPSSSGDTYAILDTKYIRGGLKHVDILSDLDTITFDRRKTGMVVSVSGDTSYYKLGPEPWSYTISDWSSFLKDDIYVTGATLSTGYTLTLNRNDNVGVPVNLAALASDVYVLSGVYDGVTGVVTFTNSTGGTFDVSGFTSGLTEYWTSGSSGNYSIKANNDSGLDALGNYSVAEGDGTIAIGNHSHAEGYLTTSIGEATHAEGISTISGWKGFTVTGVTNGILALNSIYGDVTGEFGSGNNVILKSGFNKIYSINYVTFSSGTYTEIILNDTTVNSGSYVADINNLSSQYADNFLGNNSHVEGNYSKALGNASHSEGAGTTAIGEYSHAEGNGSVSIGDSSHSEGVGVVASGDSSHAEGNLTSAIGTSSHSEGESTTAIGFYSHSEGLQTTSFGDGSHAEGDSTIASGYGSHAEGELTTAIGNYSHAEGTFTTAIGNYSHVEGSYTIAQGDYSHAEGESTTALGYYSHVQNYLTTAIGQYSHAGGNTVIASGDTSFVHGYNSIAGGNNTIVLGASITGLTSDTTYVDRFNIKTLGANTPIYNLGIDLNGDVVTGSSTTFPLSAVTAVGNTTTDDIEITDFNKGIILRSPDNTRWRLTVDNSGSLITTIVV